MRSPIITILAVILLVAVIVPADSSDADTPARLYFFDADNVCIAEIILMPGEPLNGADVPYHGSYKAWYDDHGNFVNGGMTFSSGDHIIKAYDIDNPPEKVVDKGPDYSIPILVGIIVVAVGVIVYLFIKR